MNGKVAILCPTRSRPAQLSALAHSVAETSQADVLAYVDDDQVSAYEKRGARNLVKGFGRRIGPVAACNFLVEAYPNYSAYGIITDDSIVTIPKWDQWLLSVLEAMPYAVVSPRHNHGEHVDMPFVSRRWIDTVGWYAHPGFYHYCWPIFTGLIGEMTAIVHAGDRDFFIEHDYQHQTNLKLRRSDGEKFFDLVTTDMAYPVRMLRLAMQTVEDETQV